MINEREVMIQLLCLQKFMSNCSDNLVNIECITLAMGFEAQFEPKQEQKLKNDQFRLQYIFQFLRVKLQK